MEKMALETAPAKENLENILKETKIVDSEGNPIIMYNRSNSEFENFELGKRNLTTKDGVNHFGFFFSNRNDLDHYGDFVRARYLNIKQPWDIRDLGHRTEYKNFRAKLSELGISDKDLAGFDLQFQDQNIKRNKNMGSKDGLYKKGSTLTAPIFETRMATYNFFDAGEGYYLRKLLQDKGFDGVLFADEGELTAVAFEASQVIDPTKLE